MIHQRRMRLLFTILVIMGGFGLTKTAQAQAIIRGDRIPAGTVFENDAFLTGSEVVLDGTVLGDVLAIGSDVVINGTVEGSLVVVGERVTLDGQVDGSVYVGGVNLELGPSASVGWSLYHVGARLVSHPDSQIGRDLVAATLGAELSGGVGRDVRAIIGITEIVGRILNAFDRGALEVLPIRAPGSSEFDELTSSRSASPYQVRSKPISYRNEAARTSNQALVSPLSAPARQDDETGGPATDFQEWVLVRVRQLASFLIVGGLAAWLTPIWFSRWATRLRDRPLASAGHGLVAFITGFGGVLIIALLIFAVGLALRLATLRALALTFWGMGFSGLGLAFFAFLMFALFMSKVIVSYLGGLLILERFFPRAAQRKAWPLLLGLGIYVLLRAIPVLGWVIGLIVTFLGLGAVWLAYSESRAITAVPMLEEE